MFAATHYSLTFLFHLLFCRRDHHAGGASPSRPKLEDPGQRLVPTSGIRAVGCRKRRRVVAVSVWRRLPVEGFARTLKKGERELEHRRDGFRHLG